MPAGMGLLLERLPETLDPACIGNPLGGRIAAVVFPNETIRHESVSLGV